MSEQNSYQKWGQRVRDLGFSSRLLELIILPTEKCNFRCRYCYEDFKIGKMNLDTVNAVKKLLDSRAKDIEFLKLDFFGGEPLIARDIIFSICEHANTLSQYYGFRFQASASTNGYFLSPSLVRDLRRVGLSAYQVTLDGDKDVHDVWRIKANGSGSFDKIWSNLLSLRDSNIDFNIVLRIHVQPKTVSSVRRLLKMIGAEFEGDDRFVVAFKALAHLGSKNDEMYDVFDVSSRKFKDIIEEFKREFVRTLILDFHDNERDPYICYASRANSFVIRADGRVGKCTVALDDDKNVIGRLADDGRLLVDSRQMTPWIRGLWSLNVQELTCPLMNFPRG